MVETVTKATGNLVDRLFVGEGSALALIVAGFVAMITFMDYRRSDFSLKRLDTAISPLFELIEPTMMRQSPDTPDPETLRKTAELLSSNPLLSGGKLRSYRNISLDSPNLARDWIALCKRASLEYDRLSRWNNLPRRSIAYRVRNYKARFAVFPIICLLAKYLFAFACMIVSFLAGCTAVKAMIVGNPELVVPCLGLCLSFALLTWITSK